MSFMDRIIARQPDLRAIWEEAFRNRSASTQKVVIDMIDNNGKRVISEASLLRRGYKISYTHSTGLFELLATFSTDYYKYPDDKTINRFLKVGFARAADEQQIKRDKARIERYNKKINKANDDRNDSLMIHWRKRRQELIDKVSTLQEKMNNPRYYEKEG